MFIGILIFLSGLFVSGVAAYYSIMGLIAIFASAQFAIAIMGVSLEVAKLVTAAWLHYNWKKVNFLMKAYLSSAVVLLIFITSMGIFGFLSKAHIDQTISAGDNTVVIERIEQKIAREQRNIADSEQVIAQLDQAVQTLMDYDRIRGKDGAIAVRQSQKEERAELAQIIEESQTIIDELEGEKLELSKEQIALEAEVGPLKYIAELIYGDEAKDHFDEAVRWVIILLVFVFDPLAVTMLLAANVSFKESRKHTVPVENIGAYEEIDDEDIENFTDFINTIPEERPAEPTIEVELEESTSINPETGEEIRLKRTNFGSEGYVLVPDITMTEEQVSEAKEIFRLKEEPSTLWDKFWKHKQEQDNAK